MIFFDVFAAIDRGIERLPNGLAGWLGWLVTQD